MRTASWTLVLICCPLLSAAGEAAGGAPARREVAARLQALGALPFLTPRDARGEGVKLSLAGGKAKVSLPCKAGGVTVFYAQGNVAVVPGDAAGPGNAPTALVPREGFSQPLVLDLPCADESTNKVGLAFARSKGDSELLVRNLAVAATQAGDHSVYVVDDNCNGKYNDAGQDAIIIDAGRLAVPLSPTVMLGGVPHKIEVAENGQKLSLTPAPARTGLVGLVSQGAYAQVLAGAVLKGPDGSFFPLIPNVAMPLPAGDYSLEFASLVDGAGRKAIIKDGNMKVKVGEGTVPAAVNLGTPSLKLTAKVDAKAGNVTLTALGGDAIECAAGKISYLFPTPEAYVRFYDQGNNKRLVGSFNVGMEGKGLSTTFSPNSHGMHWGINYQAEMTWPVGVGPAPFGSAGLNLPRR